MGRRIAIEILPVLFLFLSGCSSAGKCREKVGLACDYCARAVADKCMEALNRINSNSHFRD